MTMNLTRFALCCCLGLTLALAGCLPGKEKEKQVLVQNDEALKNVLAERAAANMAQIASAMLAASDAPDTSTDDVHTVRCGDSVVAYIPRSAKIATNGVLGAALAQRVRTDLQRQVKDATRVTTLQDADVACALDAGVIALNSPILVLDSSFAAAQEKPVDVAQIDTVTMAKCQGDQPGVIVTRTYKDGRDPVIENKCGQAAPKDVTDLVVGTEQVPDWKERLSGGDPNARTNFSCLVTDQGCQPIEPRELGTTIVCDDDDTPQELVANPGNFDKDAKAFLPQPGPEDCGHGWQGDVIARIKKKDCRIVRDGAAERPALVMDVAYVGAECEKSVKTEDSCPAQANNPTGRMINGYNIYMTDPVAAVPHFDANIGQNISDIAWNDGTQTNVNDPEISTLIAAPQTVLYAETQTLGGPAGAKIATGKIIQQTKDLFTVGQDLNKLTTNERFDTSMVKELQIANKWGQGEDVECFVKAQTCVGGDPPEVIAVVADRSGSMQAGAPAAIRKQTYCRATMANLFAPEYRDRGCAAAKEYKRLAEEETDLREQFQQSYQQSLNNLMNDPYYEGSYPHNMISDSYNEQMTYLDETYRALLEQQANILTASVKEKRFMPNLQKAVMAGQTCESTTVPLNMYGQCAPQFASAADFAAGKYLGWKRDYTVDLASLPKGKDNGSALRSCQSACPGECVTYAVQYDGSGNAVANTSNTRMTLVDTFVEGNLVPNLPLGTKFYYAEFINSSPDSPDNADPTRRPIEVDLTPDWIQGTGSQLSDYDRAPFNPTTLNRMYKLRNFPFASPFPGYIDTTAVLTEATKLNNGSTDFSTLQPDMLKRINELFTPSAEVIDQAWVFNKVAPGMAPKFQPRPESAAGGMTPLYVSVDLGLDRILEVLKDRPDANTALVILSDGDDTGSSSKYFGRNFCTPEDVPTGYNCIKDGGRRCCKRVLGVCVRRCDNPDIYTPVDDVKVREQFKIATLTTRVEWCKANNLGDGLDEAGYTGQQGQVNSLVGLIGANFPNTKIYYLDMLDPDNGNQATRIGRECKDENSRYGDRQVLQVFLYDNNTLDTLMQGVAGAVSTTISDPEIGKQVCKWKFGDGFTNFVFEDVENEDEIGNAGLNNELLETCDGPIKPSIGSVSFTRSTYLPKPGEGYYTAASVVCQPNADGSGHSDLLGEPCTP